MSDPLELLHAQKQEKYNKKTELKSTSTVSSDSLAKELPVVEYKFFNIDTSNLTTIFTCADSVILGNSSGGLHIFSYRESEIMSLNPPKKVKSPVVSMDIWQSTLAIVGLSSGQLLVYDLKSSKHVKTFSKFTSPIIKLKFFGSSEQVICLSNKLTILELKKKVLNYSFKATELENMDKAIVTFEVLTDEKISESYLLIVSYSRLLIYSMANNSINFQISSIRPEATPYIAWIKSMDKYHLAISYSTTIAVYNVLRDGFNASLCFETIQDVCGMKWLRQNLLATIGRHSDIFIFLLEGRTQQLVQQIRVNLEIKEQNFLRDEKGLPCYTFHNSVSKNEKTVVLGKERLCLFNVFVWNSCLDALISNGKWLEAFSLGCIFLQDHGFAFMELVPGKIEVKLKMQEILNKFVEEANSELEFKVKICMEYCIKYNMNEVLFSQLFEKLLNFGNTAIEVFSCELALYVQNGVIRSVPSGCFTKVIDYFIGKNKFDLLENVILHIDPAALDAKLLSPICDKYNLINAYMYVYTQSSLQSYVNPLKKMFKLMQKAVDPARKQYFMYNILWFLKLCFTGTTFPQETIIMKNETRENNILKVVDWLFKRKHFEGLLDIDSDTSLKVADLIFSDPQVFNLLSSPKNSVSYKSVLEKFASILNSNCTFTSKVTLFTVKLMKCGKATFDSEEKIRISKFLIKSQSFSEDETFILSLIQSSEPLKDKDLTELLKLANQTKHLGILSYLYKAAKEYQEAMNCLMQSESRYQQRKVFKLLTDTFQELPEKEKPEFKELVLRNLSELSKIDTELLGKFMNACFHDDHSLIIERLSAAPKLQMQYLTDLVNSNFKLDDKLILLNIKLLCEYNPEGLMHFLVSLEEFSYHESLKIVKQFSHSEGISFMYEKLGLIRDAILVLTSKNEDIKYNILKQVKSGLKVEGDLIEKFESYFRSAKELCKRNAPIFPDNEYNENWYLLINKIFEFYSEFSPTFPSFPELLVVLDSVIKSTLESMIGMVDFGILINNLTSKHRELTFKHLKEPTFFALSRFNYTENTISRVNSLVLKDKSMITDKLIDYYCQGVSSDDFFCSRCKKEVDMASMINTQETVIIYQDGSIYHSSCIKKGKNF